MTELPEIIQKAKQGRILADLRPTEDAAKVKACVLHIFPEARLMEEDGKITGETDLGFFKGILEKQRIRSTIADVMEQNRSGGTTFVDLSKLAAEAGRVGIDEDFPLGKIRLILTLEGYGPEKE